MSGHAPGARCAGKQSRSEGVKKLPRSQKQRNALVGNQVFAKTIFRSFRFFHTFSATLSARPVVELVALRPVRRPAQRRGGGIARARSDWPCAMCPLRGQIESQRDSIHQMLGGAFCKSVVAFCDRLARSASDKLLSQIILAP
jgi:hypothetical protein